MSTHDDGGPAFPQLDCYVNANGEQPVYTTHDGLSLRDYFAAKAFHAAITVRMQAPPDDTPIEFDMQSMARLAYIGADAMLKARGKA